MKPLISPIRLTIVDFMGSLLPGIVWSILVLTCLQMIGVLELTEKSNPLDITLFLVGLKNKANLNVIPGSVFYCFFIIFSLLFGYVMKALALTPAEILAMVSRFLWVKMFWSNPKKNPDNHKYKIHRL